jgi:hypothetical protein
MLLLLLLLLLLCRRRRRCCHCCLLLTTTSTRSEVVVPLVCPVSKSTMAVLDIDSDLPAAFDTVDVQHLEELCSWLAAKYSIAQLPDASKLQQ